MAYLLCEDCGMSFRPPAEDTQGKCPDCGSMNTHREEDDEE